jgi:hypothetical protein
MSVLIEIVVATFFTLVFSKGEEVKPDVAEKAKTEKVCKIFSEEC